MIWRSSTNLVVVLRVMNVSLQMDRNVNGQSDDLRVRITLADMVAA
jgi:hypothetical protein